jgi:hypothetical protein
MSKHAFLIMAHNEFGVLKKLIHLMDDSRNDIYVHIDKKVKGFEPHEYFQLVNCSKLIFVPRTPVTWGAYSQINAELVLLKSAVKNNYEYYHLLSGSDLPIKTQDEAYTFFEQHKGLELISYNAQAYETKNFYFRLQLYYFFQELMGKNRKGILGLLNRASLKTQELLRVNRIKHSKLDYNKGMNWFSITHELAEFVLSREKDIRKNYRFTVLTDEVFLHTLAWNSHFKEKVCNEPTRLVKRGKPFIFRADDFEFIMASKAFWARKFSEVVDPIIIEKIYNKLLEKKK